METLKLRALIKDGHFYRTLITRGDGFIYDLESNSAMGRNVEEVVQYLKNPLNDTLLEKILAKIEKYWNE